jgi:hypothetical protein
MMDVNQHLYHRRVKNYPRIGRDRRQINSVHPEEERRDGHERRSDYMTQFTIETAPAWVTFNGDDLLDTGFSITMTLSVARNKN